MMQRSLPAFETYLCHSQNIMGPCWLSHPINRTLKTVKGVGGNHRQHPQMVTENSNSQSSWFVKVQDHSLQFAFFFKSLLKKFLFQAALGLTCGSSFLHLGFFLVAVERFSGFEGDRSSPTRIKPASPALRRRFLTTGPPGKSLMTQHACTQGIVCTWKLVSCLSLAD